MKAQIASLKKVVQKYGPAATEVLAGTAFAYFDQHDADKVNEAPHTHSRFASSQLTGMQSSCVGTPEKSMEPKPIRKYNPTDEVITPRLLKKCTTTMPADKRKPIHEALAGMSIDQEAQESRPADCRDDPAKFSSKFGPSPGGAIGTAAAISFFKDDHDVVAEQQATRSLSKGPAGGA